ncbi:MAG: hypothetical protein OHK0021_13830 [Bryobacter sp.]
MKKLLFVFALTLTAQQRLSVNWLVREDLFAGLLGNDRARLEAAVATLDQVAPFENQPRVLAWRFAAEMMRAVWTHEDGKPTDFRRHYALAMTYIDQCRATAKGQDSILPPIFEGATYAVVADRLPENLRAGAWDISYQSYKALNQIEALRLERLPVHMKGEILAGLALATQRTNRTAELSAALEAVITRLPNTPYSRAAEAWRKNPESAAKVRIACLTCHEANTLGPLLERTHKVAAKYGLFRTTLGGRLPRRGVQVPVG